MGCCPKKTKPVGIDKLKSILDGWKNIVWPDPVVKKIAEERATVCADCTGDHNRMNWCNQCGCFIPAKARSLAEVCEYWNEIDLKYGL